MWVGRFVGCSVDGENVVIANPFSIVCSSKEFNFSGIKSSLLLGSSLILLLLGTLLFLFEEGVIDGLPDVKALEGDSVVTLNKDGVILLFLRIWVSSDMTTTTYTQKNDMAFWRFDIIFLIVGVILWDFDKYLCSLEKTSMAHKDLF